MCFAVSDMEHFFQTIYITSIGQHLDCNSSYNKKKNNLDGFTMELFNTIAIKKTSYYTMRFPLYLGLLLVKDGHLKPRKEWSEICYNLGILLQLQVSLRVYLFSSACTIKLLKHHTIKCMYSRHICACVLNICKMPTQFSFNFLEKYRYRYNFFFRKSKQQIVPSNVKLFKLQNDYIDSFGPESVTGKAGSDIQEGKLTWVAVTAIQLCNDQQREIFKEFYGSDDPNHVNKIKEVFKELKIPQLYEVHESKVYNDLVNKINALPTEGESKFFLNLLNKWYKRVL